MNQAEFRSLTAKRGSASNLGNWTKTIGNKTVITYFTGVETRNPSGATTNIDKIEYTDSNNLVVLTEE